MIHNLLKSYIKTDEFRDILVNASEPYPVNDCRYMRPSTFLSSLLGIGRVVFVSDVVKFLHGEDNSFTKGVNFETLLEHTPDFSYADILAKHAFDEERPGYHIESFQVYEFFQICSMCNLMKDSYWELPTIMKIAESFIMEQDMQWIYFSLSVAANLLNGYSYFSKKQTHYYGIKFNDEILDNLYGHEPSFYGKSLTCEQIAITWIGAMLSEKDTDNYYEKGFNAINEYADISKYKPKGKPESKNKETCREKIKLIPIEMLKEKSRDI